jgi:hypothetical protein
MDTSALSAKQRQAIVAIIEAQRQGVAYTRLFSTPYSCQWCGREMGRSGDGRDERKQLLSTHEADCARNGKPWPFVASHAIFYGKWKNDPDFSAALTEARDMVLKEAVSMALFELQISTPEAVAELRRQVQEGEKDTDRRHAAIAILDRADVSTAPKESEALGHWLAALRGAENGE